MVCINPVAIITDLYRWNWYYSWDVISTSFTKYGN